MKRKVLLFFTIQIFWLYTFTVAEDTEPKLGEKISLSVPKLSEEETESNHMPSHLRCDACIAVAHQIFFAFSREKAKKSSIKEYDILDILENTCNKAFDGYGVKQVNNVNRLSGPGLEAENIMGMTQMGGRWPHRLQEMCHYYIGEAGELDIYKVFTKGRNKLIEFLCHGKGIYSHCTQLKPSLRKEL